MKYGPIIENGKVNMYEPVRIFQVVAFETLFLVTVPTRCCIMPCMYPSRAAGAP